MFPSQEKYDDLKWVEETLFSFMHPSCPFHIMVFRLMTEGVTHAISSHLTPPSSHKRHSYTVHVTVCFVFLVYTSKHR